MRAEQGLTLIEVIVTIAIVSVLAAIAVPSYRYVINSSRVSSDMNSLMGALQFARAEALKRGQSVVVCSSSTSTATTKTCSGANTWQVGWFTFVDADSDGTFDNGEEVIAVQAALSSANSFVASNSTSSIRFNRQGFVTGLANPVTIALTPSGTDDANQRRCLSVGSVGRLTVLKPSQGACT